MRVQQVEKCSHDQATQRSREIQKAQCIFPAVGRQFYTWLGFHLQLMECIMLSEDKSASVRRL
jgi:hypothetical protein